VAKKPVEYNPNVIIATKTLAAIDAAIQADGGNAFRYWQGVVMPTLDDAYRVDEDPFRSHLGASGLGDDCHRKIYYDWRWFTRKKWPSRMLRLFNRGHLEEGRIIALLLMIGVEVYQQDANRKQFRISFASGHGGGAGDGWGVGIPDLPPGTKSLFEFKTYNDKRFKELQLNGVKIAKEQHYTQMQTYMRKMGLTVGVYFGVNKNDDDLYSEIIYLNPYWADEKLELGERLVYAKEPPKKISNSAGWYKCKMCDHYGVCQLKQAPDRNCRTCIHSEPLQDGTWMCNKYSCTLTKQLQFTGCAEGYEPR